MRFVSIFIYEHLHASLKTVQWITAKCNNVNKQKTCCFIVAPCILISPKSFIYQQMHFISVLEDIKIYIKTYIKIAPTCFGLGPSSDSLHVSLDKVTFIKSVKVSRYVLCGCVAACYIKSMVVCVLCTVSLCTAHSTHTHTHTQP
jgi:hypothetical protein